MPTWLICTGIFLCGANAAFAIVSDGIPAVLALVWVAIALRQGDEVHRRIGRGVIPKGGTE